MAELKGGSTAGGDLITTSGDLVSLTTHVDGDGSDHADVVTNTSKFSYPGSASAAELNILDGAILTTTELNYVDGVTLSIQSQLNDKINNTNDTMSGTLTVDTINISSVNPADTATIFGTDSAGDSTFHIRIGNGSGDKIQFESWNGSSSTGLLEITQSDVNILGNLTVSGTTTTIDSSVLNVTDSDITLNSGQVSAVLNASIIADRGSSTDAKILWNETNDKWQIDNGSGSSASILDSSQIKSGSGTFNNTALATTTITHNSGTTSYYISVTPTAVTGGYLGEWYVINIFSNTFDVVKTGSASNITFHWQLQII